MADAKTTVEQDDMAAEWAAALEQQSSSSASEIVPSEQVAPAAFTNFAPTPTGADLIAQPPRP